MARLTDEQEDRVTLIERNLYEVMPGAKQHGRINLGDGLSVPAWGDVEHTQHYEFCHLIAHEAWCPSRTICSACAESERRHLAVKGGEAMSGAS